VAYGSGDKGDTANIGIAALRPGFTLSCCARSRRNGRAFSSNVGGPVVRYRLDNLCAMNFVLRGALGGGGTTSLLVDAQGKTLAQGLMNMPIDVASELVGGS
jgi:hypothetical protein